MKRGDAFLWKEGTHTRFGVVQHVDDALEVCIVSVQGAPYGAFSIPSCVVEGLMMNLLLMEAEGS